MSLGGGVCATAWIMLISEKENLSDMDGWYIFLIQDMFPDNRHLITLVSLTIFLQQYLKLNDAFQA